MGQADDGIRIGIPGNVRQDHGCTVGSRPFKEPSPWIVSTMSRKDVAAYVGISPEAVSRALRELASRGLISIRGRHRIRINDRARLEAIIGSGST